MKINNSTIIIFFIIYVSCLDKSKNVEISFLISNIYVTEGMYEKKSLKTMCMPGRLGPENRRNFLWWRNFFGGYCTTMGYTSMRFTSMALYFYKENT
jgi:hypothetical protein